MPLTRDDFHGEWNYTITPALHDHQSTVHAVQRGALRGCWADGGTPEAAAGQRERRADGRAA
jgi:hypothetical protein